MNNVWNLTFRWMFLWFLQETDEKHSTLANKNLAFAMDSKDNSSIDQETEQEVTHQTKTSEENQRSDSINSPSDKTDKDNDEYSSRPQSCSKGLHQRSGSTQSSVSVISSQSDICRICHCEGDEELPLVTPCLCLGSLQHVHQACLQQWIKSSDTKSCELCRFKFVMQTKLKPIGKVGNGHLFIIFNQFAPGILLVFLNRCTGLHVFLANETKSGHPNKRLFHWHFENLIISFFITAVFLRQN